MNFYETFKKLRKTLGLNQTDFGKIFGLSQRVISDLEKGKSNPSNTLMAYLKYRWSNIFPDDSNVEGIEIEMKGGKQPHFIESPVFQQKELARDVNYELLKLERLRPDALIEVKDFIKFKIAMYDRRHDERRKNDATDFDPNEERRSGLERRKAVGS